MVPCPEPQAVPVRVQGIDDLARPGILVFVVDALIAAAAIAPQAVDADIRSYPQVTGGRGRECRRTCHLRRQAWIAKSNRASARGRRVVLVQAQTIDAQPQAAVGGHSHRGDAGFRNAEVDKLAVLQIGIQQAGPTVAGHHEAPVR